MTYPTTEQVEKARQTVYLGEQPHSVQQGFG